MRRNNKINEGYQVVTQMKDGITDPIEELQPKGKIRRVKPGVLDNRKVLA